MSDITESAGEMDEARPVESGAEGPSSRPRSAGWRILRFVLGLLVSLLLLPIVLLLLVLGTQTGLRTAIGLAEDAFPDFIQVGQADGRVLGHLSLRDLAVHLPTLDLAIGRIDLDWTPWAIVEGLVSVQRLAASDIDLTLAPSPEPKEKTPFTLPDILLPVRVEVGEALVERFRLFQQGVPEPGIVLERATLGAALRQSQLRLTKLEAQLAKPVEANARVVGQADLTKQYPLDLDLSWDLRLNPTVHLNGTGKLEGDLQRLAVRHQLRGPVEADVDIQVQDVLDAPSWNGLLQLLKVDLPALRPDLPPVATGARLETHGNLDEATLTGTLDAKASGLPDFGHLAAALDVTWKDRQLEIRTLDLTEQVSKATFGAKGHLDLTTSPGRFDLTGGWERLRWPLSGDLLAQSPRGDFKASGDLDAYDYRLSAEALGPKIPGSKLALEGQGSMTGTDIKRLVLDTLGGRIDGQVKATFTPQVGWDAAIGLAGVDPGRLAPEWPGRIDGRLTSRGALTDAGPKLTAVIERLAGTLRGYPVAAAGKVLVEGKTTRIEGFTAESGPSRLRLDGRVDEALDLGFDLQSPDLASLLPKAKGRVQAKGKVLGPLAAPRVNLDLLATDAAFAEQGIASLSGNADLDLAKPGRFAIRLDGKDLKAGGRAWKDLTVRGEGAMPDHRLTVTLGGDWLGVKLAAAGGLADGGAYKGNLSALDLTSKEAGHWKLQRAAGFSLDKARLQAGPLCLRHDKGSGGCVDFDQAAAGKWRANLDLDKLDFALLEKLLPPNITADGVARLKGRFQADGASLVGQATAEIPQGRARLDLGKGKVQELDFSTTRLTLDAGGKGLSARLGLPLKDLASLDADLSLPGWRFQDPARPGQPLQGRLRADVRALARIAHLVPDLNGLAGSVDADLALGGTLAKPGVKGQAHVRQVGFEVPLIALAVKDFSIDATAPSFDRMDIKGGATLGKGRLDLTGSSRLVADGFDARVQVSGKSLQVANSKEYFVVLSPTFELQATPKGAELRGEIDIPEARIRPRSVPAGSVSSSPDVALTQKTEKPAYPVTIDIRLALGKEVTIDAFGVRGRLDGALRVFQMPGKDMLGDGQLQISEGQYQLSGGFGLAAKMAAPLTITQGRLIYAKSPIGNPGLLLQAEREGGDTTAGVRVLGTLRDPKMAFFSESDPGMTQAEITKYLMTGIPPSANDRASNAGLAVGTYIAPKIYMEYESGLGNEANKVRLRYDLSRRIELQTETGESQGADVYFKFEN